MSLPHFFIDAPLEGAAGTLVQLSLDAETTLHMRTLRLRAQEHIIMVDKPGHGWELQLTSVPSRRSTVAEGVLIAERTAARPIELTLVQGISAADRMDQTIRQTTELGVARIIPLSSERSTVRLEEEAREGKRQRWQRIARSAAEQSGQLMEPTIERAVGLTQALELVKDSDALLFFWEESGGRSLAAALDEHLAGKRAASGRRTGGEGDAAFCSRVALFVGPEGGFSVDEARELEAAGARTVTLGETILRTETAAVVACALTLYQLGALGAQLGALGAQSGASATQSGAPVAQAEAFGAR
jgi:16S rRNA (uracil1498-N3)-methyltransferase